jgi:hypothetical protein
MQTRLDALITFFESLSQERVSSMGALYADAVYFKDPFNEVQTLAQVQAIFNHMYLVLEQPRFVVTNHATGSQQCFLTWNFEFYFKNRPTAGLQTIRGSSHIRFNDSGLVVYHRDYWDAAEELYEKLPVLGGLMRWLKKRASS